MKQYFWVWVFSERQYTSTAINGLPTSLCLQIRNMVAFPACKFNVTRRYLDIIIESVVKRCETLHFLQLLNRYYIAKLLNFLSMKFIESISNFTSVASLAVTIRLGCDTRWKPCWAFPKVNYEIVVGTAGSWIVELQTMIQLG